MSLLGGGGVWGTSRAPHPLTPSPQAACGVTSGPVPPTAPTCPRSATPRTGTCWWTGATSTTCQVSEPTGLAGPPSMSERVCACLCLCVPLGRLPVALRPRQHDALGLPAAAVRPEGRAPAHGRRLHQQPARQVAARSPARTSTHGRARGQAPRRVCACPCAATDPGSARGRERVELESTSTCRVQRECTRVDTHVHAGTAGHPSGFTSPHPCSRILAAAHRAGSVFSHMHVARPRHASLHTYLSTCTLHAGSGAHKCKHTDGHVCAHGELPALLTSRLLRSGGPAVPRRISRARERARPSRHVC